MTCRSCVCTVASMAWFCASGSSRRSRSKWSFGGPGLSHKIRAILLAEQLQVDEVAADPGDKGDSTAQLMAYD